MFSCPDLLFLTLITYVYYFQLFLLIFGLLSIATGLAIFSSVLASMPSNLFYNEHTEDLSDNDIVVTCSEIPTGIVVLCVFFIVTGVVCVGK